MQAGTTVVYIIEDTGKLVYTCPGLKGKLKRMFLDLLARNPANVRLAALRHGAKTQTYVLKMQDRKYLGGRSGGPYMFSPNPKNPKDPFRAPSQIANATVTDAIDALVFSDTDEYLYPAIDLAWEMIKTECPPPAAGTPTPPPATGTPTPTPKPWCKHKIIVILGRGEPGKAADDYFHKTQQLTDVLPEELLERLKDLNIKLHTLCLGRVTCQHKQYFRPHGHAYGPPNRYYTNTATPKHLRDTGYRGGDIMRELATRTGGTFHGVVP